MLDLEVGRWSSAPHFQSHSSVSTGERASAPQAPSRCAYRSVPRPRPVAGLSGGVRGRHLRPGEWFSDSGTGWRRRGLPRQRLRAPVQPGRYGIARRPRRPRRPDAHQRRRVIQACRPVGHGQQHRPHQHRPHGDGELPAPDAEDARVRPRRLGAPRRAQLSVSGPGESGHHQHLDHLEEHAAAVQPHHPEHDRPVSERRRRVPAHQVHLGRRHAGVHLLQHAAPGGSRRHPVAAHGQRQLRHQRRERQDQRDGQAAGERHLRPTSSSRSTTSRRPAS